MEISTLPKAGDRIQLLEMPDDPAPIDKGSLGTVEFANDLQIGVKWDSGRTLMLVPKMDRWRIIDDSSSGSRQHYIDTGEYLAPGEAGQYSV